MIDCLNNFLQSLIGDPTGNQINNETQLHEQSCSIEGIKHIEVLWMAQCRIFNDPDVFNNLIITAKKKIGIDF